MNHSIALINQESNIFASDAFTDWSIRRNDSRTNFVRTNLGQCQASCFLLVLAAGISKKMRISYIEVVSFSFHPWIFRKSLTEWIGCFESDSLCVSILLSSFSYFFRIINCLVKAWNLVDIFHLKNKNERIVAICLKRIF